ncbi:ABC transporter permease [Auraticoccus monumenti]|uniref:Oligopeptide transport system permease protein OppC n=1 Tax=Auraticoccus monumenti TaxID=675864 RepID=A0A1G6YPF9_9ACTN|nr:ABC transporter permease [Auraticoccus monumenti]SDD91426.1 peptide/nickel transport system permease protein [Auraticoccus monumenti]
MTNPPMPPTDSTEVLDETPVPSHGPSAPTSRRLSRRRLVLRRFLRNKTAVLGLLVILAMAALAVFGPLISAWDYEQIDRTSFLNPPDARHPFGTTQSGIDMFALTLRGLSKSLLIGLAVALISTAIAAVVGSFAAYYGGWFERIALWVIDLLLVVPSFLIIAIMMSADRSGGNASAFDRFVASAPQWIVLIILLALFSWMLAARVVRSLTLSVKEREYVEAARFMGIPGPIIVVRHILPNISSLLIIDATLNVAAAILAETSLSFFGFGVKPPDTSLGALLGVGARQATTFPWLFVPPAVAVVLLILAVNAVGDGLRDALDPSSGSGGRV